MSETLTLQTSVNLTYLPAGPGTAARNVEDKLRDVVSVKDFGAKGDGVTNDSVSFQLALNTARRVIVPAGVYILGGVSISSGTVIEGEGAKSILYMIGGDDGTSDQTPEGRRSMMYIKSDSVGTQVEKVTLRNLFLRDDVVSRGFAQYRYLLLFDGVADLCIENCHFYGWRGDGLMLSGDVTTPTLPSHFRHNKRIVIRDCTFDGVQKENRNAISIVDVDGALITNCFFRNCTRDDMPGAIDMEPNGYLDYVVRNVTVENCHFSNIGGNV